MEKGKLKKVVVVGAGTMGHGITQSFAQGGYQVSMVSRTQKTLDKALELIEGSLSTMVQEGVLDKDLPEEVMKRINLTTSLEEGSYDADIAIETVAENKDAKKEVFAQLDSYCPDRALLVSNTSFLNIFDFVETARPDKVLIAHWYAPPQLIPLVEVVGGPNTDEANVQLMTQILRGIGKRPMILKKFIPGYAINRIQHAITREVHFLLDNDYVTPEQLDGGARAGLAFRMMVTGLAQKYDLSGLSMRIINPPGYEDAPLDYRPKKLAGLIEQGHLGVKTGRGFYDYKGKSEAEVYHERDIRLIQMLKVLETLEARGPLESK